MPSLICAGCGHVNGAEARFCEECGSSLAPHCSSWRGTSLPDVGGGLFELTVGQVTVVEHGKFVSVDQYEPDDREAMLARFAQLSGAPAALPGRSVEPQSS